MVPWRCATHADGSTKWVSRTTVSDEIATNRVWGETVGLPLHDDDLVTGEHSGLKVLPQQPEDNPNLAPALADNGIAWLASDNSRDPAQRGVGPATTVSRYPMNVFFVEYAEPTGEFCAESRELKLSSMRNKPDLGVWRDPC